MRIVYVFFLSLCFLLLRGYTVNASTQHTAILNTTRQSKAQADDISRHNTTIKNNAISEQGQYLAAAEDEDEDPLQARKYVLLTKCFFVLSCSLLPGYINRYLTYRLPFCTHLADVCSSKYIVQRALRI